MNKRFHKCQCWRKIMNERYEVLQSYVTDIAIVDHKLKRVYVGKHAEGFSRTTTRQFSRMMWEWFRGYEKIYPSDRRYKRFMTVERIPDGWDSLNKAHDFLACFYIKLDLI